MIVSWIDCTFGTASITPRQVWPEWVNLTQRKTADTARTKKHWNQSLHLNWTITSRQYSHLKKCTQHEYDDGGAHGNGGDAKPDAYRVETTTPEMGEGEGTECRLCACMHACACMRACVRARVHACVLACARIHAQDCTSSHDVGVEC